jgi:hypothetical protein
VVIANSRRLVITSQTFDAMATIGEYVRDGGTVDGAFLVAINSAGTADASHSPKNTRWD